MPLVLSGAENLIAMPVRQLANCILGKGEYFFHRQLYSRDFQYIFSRFSSSVCDVNKESIYRDLFDNKKSDFFMF